MRPMAATPAASQFNTPVMMKVRSKTLIDSARMSALDRTKSAWRPRAVVSNAEITAAERMPGRR